MDWSIFVIGIDILTKLANGNNADDLANAHSAQRTNEDEYQRIIAMAKAALASPSPPPLAPPAPPAPPVEQRQQRLHQLKSHELSHGGNSNTDDII